MTPESLTPTGRTGSRSGGGSNSSDSSGLEGESKLLTDSGIASAEKLPPCSLPPLCSPGNW